MISPAIQVNNVFINNNKIFRSNIPLNVWKSFGFEHGNLKLWNSHHMPVDIFFIKYMLVPVSLIVCLKGASWYWSYWLPGIIYLKYGQRITTGGTAYLKKCAHGFVVLCFVVVMQSFIMNSHEVFIHIHQGCFAGTGAIVRLPQCQWSKPGGYGKISQCLTTTKHSKAKTVCIFLGIYCSDHDIRFFLPTNAP